MVHFPAVNMCFGKKPSSTRYTNDLNIIEDQDSKQYQEKEVHNIHDKIKSHSLSFAIKFMKSIKRIVKQL